MPEYSYKCPACKAKRSVVKTMAEATLPVLCDNDAFVMLRDFAADFGSQHHGDIWNKPSYALGVSPAEVPAMEKFDKEHDVPTDYTADGDPIMRDRKHRKQYCEAHGFFDRSAGYGDAVPERCR